MLTGEEFSHCWKLQCWQPMQTYKGRSVNITVSNPSIYCRSFSGSVAAMLTGKSTADAHTHAHTRVHTHAQTRIVVCTTPAVSQTNGLKQLRPLTKLKYKFLVCSGQSSPQNQILQLVSAMRAVFEWIKWTEHLECCCLRSRYGSHSLLWYVQCWWRQKSARQQVAFANSQYFHKKCPCRYACTPSTDPRNWGYVPPVQWSDYFGASSVHRKQMFSDPPISKLS